MTETKKPFKITIFTAAYGGGHLAVSNALSDAFKTYYPGEAEVAVLDYMQKFAPFRNAILKWLYVKSTLYFPTAYAWFFSISDKLFAGPVGQKFGTIGEKGAREYIETNKPDAIISVYPTPNQVVPGLGLEQMPLTSVMITDFGAHTQWIHPKTDLYFVASSEVKDFLSKLKGIPEERITVSGIPIKLVYTKPVDRAAARRKFGFTSDFIVLLMCGGQLWKDIQSVCDQLSDLPLQIAILAGKGKIYDDTVRYANENKKTLAFGIVKDLDEMMRAGDVIIGKAGGITVSESLASALPTIMFRPYPGQEYYNRDYLLNYRAGLLADNVKEVVAHLRTLYQNRPLLAEMRANALKLGHADAAPVIARTIIEALKKRLPQG